MNPTTAATYLREEIPNLLNIVSCVGVSSTQELLLDGPTIAYS